MWSLGVCGFILLSGSMPFSGNDAAQIGNITAGKYIMKPEKWGKLTRGGKVFHEVSAEARGFIRSLLEVDPSKRLTAQQALEHPWIARSRENIGEDVSMQPCCEALRRFSRTSKFRRCCLEMLAWSLSNDDRAKVRNCFLSLDSNQQGTISFPELRHVMVDKLGLVDECEILKVFRALDYNHDQEIHYSDFLAAMVETQIDVDDQVLTDAFRRFDTDNSGYITVENLRDVLGCKVEGEKVEALIAEADQNKDGRLSFAEFAAYVRGTNLNDIDMPMVADEGVPNKVRPITSKPKRSNVLKCALKGFRANFQCFNNVAHAGA